MELLGERPVWSMSDSELLPTLDQVDAAIAWLQTYRLQIVARTDDCGVAENLGARDTAELLALRYNLDRREAHRDVKLARALPRYGAVSTALTDGIPVPDPGADEGSEPSDDSASGDSADADGETGQGARLLRPAQASAIISALERVRSRVPVEDLDVAEQQLVTLARHLSPADLAKAAKQICDLLDSDGPEPDEHAAYARESLTLIDAENGVKFRGFLANDNAELFRSWIYAGARPHKTANGDLDPRSREKRQADALTTTLTIAAAATDAGHKPPTPATPQAGAETSSTQTGTEIRPPETSAGLHPSEAVAQERPTETNAGVHPAVTGAEVHPTETNASTNRAETATQVRPTETNTAMHTTQPAAEVLPLEAFADAPAAHSTNSWVPGFGAKANITVTIDLEDLKAATANATGTLVYSNNLSAAAIRRLACDANIIPLVLGSNSEPLDVGRSERLVTRAIRRALNTRDKGCVICGAPPITCDAHHLKSWIDGGETAINNLALVCRRHHSGLHAGHWTITITNGKVHVTQPTWADPPPTPRHPPRLHTPPPPRQPPRPHTPPPPRPAPRVNPPPLTTAALAAWTGSPALALVDATAPPATTPPATPDESDSATQTRRPGRWKADEAMMHEAARFAV